MDGYFVEGTIDREKKKRNDKIISNKLVYKNEETSCYFRQDSKQVIHQTLRDENYTKSENENMEENDNYRADDITKNINCHDGCNAVIENEWCGDCHRDDDTCASSIGQSVDIINSSIRKIKKNLNDIKEVINIDIGSDAGSDVGSSAGSSAGSDVGSSAGSDVAGSHLHSCGKTLSNKTRSNDSSMVRTFEDLKGDDSDESENRKRSKQIEMLLNTAINTKMEKKKIGTLDIIDECITIGNAYNFKKENHDEKDAYSSPFIVDGVPRGVSYAQSIDMCDISNLDEFLKENNVSMENIFYGSKVASIYSENVEIEDSHRGTNLSKDTSDSSSITQGCSQGVSPINPLDGKACTEKEGLSKSGLMVETEVSSPIEVEDLKDSHPVNGAVKYDTLTGTQSSVMRRDYVVKRECVMKRECAVGPCLQHVKDTIKYDKDKLTYPIKLFFKEQKKLTALLKKKKKFIYFFLHACFFFSYIFFCFSFIFFKRIFYGMFYDQDL
ncbi:hypothetical protein PGO_092460 [Plasmodium gonderi]|uniref:Uncharacterized protein n=1 Tax=Plasmodium gonderi TaxID=77519 RepID=A0A1Y1JEV9_PLAGO|nr:hypothetical protein PGO_092460 [Plasmodium gonderi]GAW81046.1 hypothetical protein PGO_092460 [Plasmodium gonderi]